MQCVVIGRASRSGQAVHARTATAVQAHGFETLIHVRRATRAAAREPLAGLEARCTGGFSEFVPELTNGMEGEPEYQGVCPLMPQCCSPLALRSTAAPDRRWGQAPASPVPVALARFATRKMQSYPLSESPLHPTHTCMVGLVRLAATRAH